VEGWLGGEAGAGGIADVLFGIANPSGKLAETFPIRLEDTPAFLDFPGRDREVHYGEGIFVGYRWYDARRIEPLFPFGHGLSYTTFAYSNLQVPKAFTDKDAVKITFTIKNLGTVAGQEVAQVYLSDKQSSLPRPPKALGAFAKIALQPGEQKEVTLELKPRDFAFYSPRLHRWVAESGAFEVQVGASSRDIRLKDTVTLNSSEVVPSNFDELTYFSEFLANPKTRSLTLETFKPWIMSHAKPGQSVDQVQIITYFTEMPIAKIPYLSKGLVSSQAVADFLKKAQELDK
jgi:beta-glucosidase